MKLLLVADSYPPEICAVSSLMNELALSLVDRGHKISVLTCKPQNRVKEGTEHNYSLVSNENNVTVIRVPIPKIHANSLVTRGINTVLLPSVLYSRTPKTIRYDNYDGIIVYSPPVSLGLAAKKIAVLNDAPMILMLRDIFPQNAIDLGILKSKLVIKYFEHVERKLYEASDYILAQSYENRQFLCERKQLDEGKVGVLYNWVDSSKYYRNETTNFRDKFRLDGKKVCVFAGTIGPSQGLEKLLSVARLVGDNDVLFLFVGNGREKDNLMKKAKSMQLTNVRFEDYVEPDEYPSLLKSVQLGLVSLSENNHTPIVPGKLLGYMAAGIPIMAFLNKESTDTMRIIDESGCGEYVTDGDIDTFSKKMRVMLSDDDLRITMGNNGRKYVETSFSVVNAAEEVERAIIKVRSS